MRRQLAVAKLPSSQRQYNTPLGHHTERGPMGLGQYNSIGKYCGSHTASSVFLKLLLSPANSGVVKIMQKCMYIHSILDIYDTRANNWENKGSCVHLFSV